MKIMGWRPPQRPEWVKMIMKTPGPIKVQLLLLLTLTISSVTSTVLLISKQGKSTLDENILHSVESLEVGRRKDGLHLRVTGKNTTEVLQNLKPMLRLLANPYSSEKSSVSTVPLEK